MILDNLNILIINSNFASRSRLRDVLKSFLLKVNVNYAQSLKEALQILKEKEIDIGFVEFDIGQKEISEFISSLHAAGAKSAPPFVATLLKRGDGSTAGITNLYLDGVSGFISEPYSSDDILSLMKTLKEAAIIAEQKNKLKKASSLLLTEISRKIDAIAEHKVKEDENSARLELKSLKTVSKGLEAIYSQDSEQYTKALIETFENIAPPANQTDRSAKQKRARLKETKHPGVVVSELMKQRGLTFESVKHTFKIDATDFQALLDGTKKLDETSSREISRVFGRTSREWMKMQKEFDAYTEELNKKELSKKNDAESASS